MLRTATPFIWAVLAAAALAPAGRAEVIVPRVDPDQLPATVVDLPPPGGQAVYLTYQEEKFLVVTADDLGKSRDLDHRPVCIEGKFESFDRVAGDVFFLVGLRTEMVVKGDKFLPFLQARARGTNLWVAGMAKAYKDEHPKAGSCYVELTHLGLLPTDFVRFQSRVSRVLSASGLSHRAAYDQLLDLVGQFDKARKIAPIETATSEEIRGKRNEVIRRGFDHAEKWIAADRPNDADAWAGLGMSYLDDRFLDPKDPQQAATMFLKAVAINPDHRLAGAQLRLLGYERWKDNQDFVSWLPADLVKQRREEQKLRDLERKAAEDAFQEVRGIRITDWDSYLHSQFKMDKAMRQASGDPSLAALYVICTYDVRPDDPDGARLYLRHAVWILANLTDVRSAVRDLQVGLFGGEVGSKNFRRAASPDVRRDLLGALYWRAPEEIGLPLLLRVFKDATDAEEVRDESLRLLAGYAAGSADKRRAAVDLLVGALPVSGSPGLYARTYDKLRDLTGQRFDDDSAWKKWWADNRASFPPAPKQPK
jgi:hypothetical protein